MRQIYTISWILDIDGSMQNLQVLHWAIELKAPRVGFTKRSVAPLSTTPILFLAKLNYYIILCYVAAFCTAALHNFLINTVHRWLKQRFTKLTQDLPTLSSERGPRFYGYHCGSVSTEWFPAEPFDLGCEVMHHEWTNIKQVMIAQQGTRMPIDATHSSKTPGGRNTNQWNSAL